MWVATGEGPHPSKNAAARTVDVVSTPMVTMAGWGASGAGTMAPETFLGFAGMNNVKFRGTVTPGERVMIVAKSVEERHRRVTFDAQSFVGEKLVFEGQIIGMPV